MKLFGSRQTKIPKPEQGELSSIRSSYFADYSDLLNGYNPDSLVTRKGLEIFDDMSRDEQVKAALNTKIYAILSTGWDIHAQDPKYEEMRDFAKSSLTDWLEGSFSDTLIELLSFLKYGYLVAEKNWTFEDGKVYLKNIKVRAPHTFEFHPDDYGNLPQDSGLQQHQDGEGLVKLPLDKFIIYSYRQEFSNRFGNSDLKEAYRPWFIKDQLVKLEAMYLEKYASPPIIAKYKSMNKTQRDQLMKVLQSMRSSSVAVIPEDVDIEFVNVITNGGIHFRKAIQAQDEAISKAILMPNQLGYNDTGSVGSNAKAQTQFDVFVWVIEAIRTAIEEAIVNEQILKPLIYYNFGEQDEYPLFKFNPLTEKDKESLFKTWYEAIKNGAALPTKEDEDYIRKSLEMPERDENSELLTPEPEKEEEFDEDGNPIEPKLDKDGNPIEGKQDGTGKPGKPKDGKPLNGDNPTDKKGNKKVDDKKKKGFESDKYPITKNMEKVNFSQIRDIMTTSEEQLTKDLDNTIANIATEAIDRIQNKNIIAKKRFDEIDKFKLKYIGDLKLAFKKMSKKVYQEGITEWKKEMPKKSMANDASEILPDEYMEWLNSKAFMESGKIADEYLNAVKAQLIFGIENGWSEKKIISNLNQMFNTTKVLGATVKPVFTNVQLQLLARMNINASFNKGRYIQALDLADKSKTPVYMLFSEVLEGGDTTSHPFSAFIHGKYVLMGTELSQRLQYPMHYNDRGLGITVDSAVSEIPQSQVLTEMPDLSQYSGLTIG